MTTQHTPTPWRCTNLDKQWVTRIRIVGSNAREAANVTYGGCESEEYPLRKADAAFIVAACNAHEGLDAYRQYVESHLEDIESGGWTPVCFAEFIESEECQNTINACNALEGLVSRLDCAAEAFAFIAEGIENGDVNHSELFSAARKNEILARAALAQARADLEEP